MNSRKRVYPSDKGSIAPEDAIIQGEQAAPGEQLVDVEEWCTDVRKL